MKDLKQKEPVHSSVIGFQDSLAPIGESLAALEKSLSDTKAEMQKDRERQNSFIADLNDLADIVETGAKLVPLPDIGCAQVDEAVDSALLQISRSAKCFPALSGEEYVISAVSGILSAIIDVVFVGTPEVVKIYRGGENFDGSLLTGLLRQIGRKSDGEMRVLFQFFSDHCKVPYDISAVKDTITPNNHRLRGLAHDPFFGWFFAVADILMGTTTCIDNSGTLRVLINCQEVPIAEKFLSVFYYIGHIISDLFTARGIPVPGAFLTQFFTNGASDESIAKIAERMYLDGYDMRHFVSMSLPVIAKNLIVDSYLRLTQPPANVSVSLAEREYCDLHHKMKREKMMFVANAVASTGNAIKFLAPPACGNVCALNMPQWLEMIRSSTVMIRMAMRDRTAETVIQNRAAIDENWKRLLAED